MHVQSDIIHLNAGYETRESEVKPKIIHRIIIQTNEGQGTVQSGSVYHYHGIPVFQLLGSYIKCLVEIVIVIVLSINQSNHQPIKQLINQSINRSIY
jgi:hypothetical protein